MPVAYHGVLPREADGEPHIAYNPYLEAGFSEGVRSNCVSCHQRAVITADGKMGEVFPLAKGQLEDDDPFFKAKLALDFVWSLATRTKVKQYLDLPQTAPNSALEPGLDIR